MLLTLLGEAHAQGLGGTDPVGLAPTPAGAFDDALRVPRAELGAPTVAVLMVGSGEASNPTAASVWGTARLPVGESASAAVAWGGHSVFEGGGGVADLHLSAPMVHHRGDGWVLGSAPFFEVPLGGAGVRGSGVDGEPRPGAIDLGRQSAPEQQPRDEQVEVVPFRAVRAQLQLHRNGRGRGDQRQGESSSGRSRAPASWSSSHVGNGTGSA